MGQLLSLLNLLKLEPLFGNKAWYKGFTGWAVLLLAIGLTGLDTVCGTAVNSWDGVDNVNALLPDWLCSQQSTETIGMILGFIGLRRRL